MEKIMKMLKIRNVLVAFCAVMFSFSTSVLAQQDAAKATENAIQTTDKIEDLRAKIEEIETKKASLQEQIRQIDEAMLPENLERTTVIAGSTRPEEIRENRRRQLEIEKKGAQSQLELLNQNRQRIEMSIATTQPKPAATPEITSNNAQTVESPAQTETLKTVVTAENNTTAAPPTKSSRRYPVKAKRKRVVRNN